MSPFYLGTGTGPSHGGHDEYHGVARTGGPRRCLQRDVGVPGLYPVRNPADLWYNPFLGSLMSTLELTNVLHTLTVPFFNGAAQPIETSNLIHLLIDNNPCVCILGQPHIGNRVADVNCGYLQYLNTNEIVEIDYLAAQPQNHANYSFGVQRAINSIFSVSGPVPAPLPFKEPVHQMMQCPQCPGQQPCAIAGFVAGLYVAATAINGWDRQSQYDRSAQTAFAMAK